MRKWMIAALLCAVAAPAQSALNFEVKGTALVTNYNYSVSLEPSYQTADFLLTGYCGIGCSVWAQPDHLTLAMPSSAPFLKFSLSFDFTPTVATPVDGLWHDGTGTGNGAVGLELVSVYSFQPTQVRLTGDLDFPFSPASAALQLSNVQAAVPEPATWTSLILGLCLTGVAIRKGRLRPAYATR